MLTFQQNRRCHVRGQLKAQLKGEQLGQFFFESGLDSFAGRPPELELPEQAHVGSVPLHSGLQTCSSWLRSVMSSLSPQQLQGRQKPFPIAQGRDVSVAVPT